MRGRLATECHYTQDQISEIVWLDVLKMADYWAIEPPLAALYKRVHFKSEQESSGISPSLTPTNYHTLPGHLKEAVRKSWLRRHPGSTESDFFKALKARGLAKYGARLEEARKAQKPCLTQN